MPLHPRRPGQPLHSHVRLGQHREAPPPQRAGFGLPLDVPLILAIAVAQSGLVGCAVHFHGGAPAPVFHEGPTGPPRREEPVVPLLLQCPQIPSLILSRAPGAGDGAGPVLVRDDGAAAHVQAEDQARLSHGPGPVADTEIERLHGDDIPPGPQERPDAVQRIAFRIARVGRCRAELHIMAVDEKLVAAFRKHPAGAIRGHAVELERLAEQDAAVLKRAFRWIPDPFGRREVERAVPFGLHRLRRTRIGGVVIRTGSLVGQGEACAAGRRPAQEPAPARDHRPVPPPHAHSTRSKR